MKSFGILAALILMAFLTSASRAADPHRAAAPQGETTSHEAGRDTHATPTANHPLLPPEGIRWPAVMLIIVVGMFLAAMVVGPVVRMTLPPEEPPVAHAHDDDPHDHGHGHGHARPRTPLDGHGGHH